MAKKPTRRDRRDVRKTRRIPAHYPGMAAPTESPSTASTAGERTRVPARRSAASPAEGRRPTGALLREDYSYVYRDLRRILFLAATIFAILIGLSFVPGFR